MPYLRIQTNVSVPTGEIPDILKAASKLAATKLGKPESYVMVHLETEQQMMFAGSSDECAFVELASLGLPEFEGKKLSSSLCGFLKDALRIPPKRIYVRMSDHPSKLWGWNGETF